MAQYDIDYDTEDHSGSETEDHHYEGMEAEDPHEEPDYEAMGESLADRAEYYKEKLPYIQGGPDPRKYPWDTMNEYLDDLEEYKEDLRHQERVAEMSKAVRESVRLGHMDHEQAVANHDQTQAAAWQQLEREQGHTYPDDFQRVRQMQELEEERMENAIRRDQAMLAGKYDEVEICNRHEARIMADINHLYQEPRMVTESQSQHAKEIDMNIEEYRNWPEHKQKQLFSHLPQAINERNRKSTEEWMQSLDPDSVEEAYRTGNPKAVDRWQVSTQLGRTSREQLKILRQDERLADVADEYLAFEAHKRGILGGGSIARIADGKKPPPRDYLELGDTEAIEEAISEGKDIVIDGPDFRFEYDREESAKEERKPERKGPKPRTHTMSRL